MRAITGLVLLVAVAYTADTVLYDLKHHKAFIVRADGCYEYHLKHNDMMMAEDMNQRPTLEARMTSQLDCADPASIHEIGHHSIDHSTGEIVNACANVPIKGFGIPADGTCYSATSQEMMSSTTMATMTST